MSEPEPKQPLLPVQEPPAQEGVEAFPLPESTRRRILSQSFKAAGMAAAMLLFPKKLYAPPNTKCRPAICRPRPFSEGTHCLPEVPCQPRLTPKR